MPRRAAQITVETEDDEQEAVVGDLDAAARRSEGLDEDELPQRHNRASASTVSGIKSALGREEYTWVSPLDSGIVVKFRRSPGGTNELIERVLGAEQSQNSPIVRKYRAVASIKRINGEEVKQPRTRAAFTAMMQRLSDDEYYDEPLNLFAFAWEYAMFPEQYDALEEAEAAGLSPDDVKRIAKASGLEHAKK